MQFTSYIIYHYTLRATNHKGLKDHKSSSGGPSTWTCAWMPTTWKEVKWFFGPAGLALHLVGFEFYAFARWTSCCRMQSPQKSAKTSLTWKVAWVYFSCWVSCWFFLIPYFVWWRQASNNSRLVLPPGEFRTVRQTKLVLVLFENVWVRYCYFIEFVGYFFCILWCLRLPSRSCIERFVGFPPSSEKGIKTAWPQSVVAQRLHAVCPELN